MYYDSTIIFLIPAMLLSMYAQYKIKKEYQKYRAVKTKNSITGERAARIILDENNLSNVNIELVGGELTDHYDPRGRVLRLSQDVYYGTSIAANAIAAHEVGHAIQHAKMYAPLKIRNSIVPAVNIASNISMPMIMLGLFMSQFNFLLNLGILLFSSTVIFQLITLPVEFDASFRAMRSIKANNILTEDEVRGGNRVLTAAALTYVAGTITALSQLLRFIVIANNRQRRN